MFYQFFPLGLTRVKLRKHEILKALEHLDLNKYEDVEIIIEIIQDPKKTVYTVWTQIKYVRESEYCLWY